MYTKTKVVIAQLGSPKSPRTSDVRSFLKEFLSDERVVDLNPLIWKPILYLFVLTLRPKKSGEAYSRIWNGKSFPLIDNTIEFTDKVRPHLNQDIEVDHAFLLSSPRVNDIFSKWENEDFDTRADRVVFLPQFPQFSESTTSSVVDNISGSLKHRVNIPDFIFVSNYHKLKAFIDHSVRLIQKTLDEKNPDALVLSFHGIPLRRVTDKKDEYYFHCYETFSLIKERIKNFDDKKIHLCFQSRFGSEVWLGPATDTFCIDLVNKGFKNIAVYCPSFVVDCLETTDEIGHELGEEISEASGTLHFINCLNADEAWAKDYAHYINVLCSGSQKELSELFYKTNKKELRESMPKQNEVVEEKLSKETKSTLKIMFLTLFLDLVGFSIIFPMFPALAKYYMLNDTDNYYLSSIMGAINSFTQVGGVSMNSIVLFGGFLGALYSLLQFFAAPFWGGLSDRIGRKPVLLISISGLVLSYILWIFSGSFTTLIIARLIGGLMSGNISVASAVVADITSEKTRSKGMAIIGISFALGFVIGPALGGILSLIDLTTIYPNLIHYGVNPFSVAALGATLLSLFNLIWVFTLFKETLSLESKKIKRVSRFKVFKPFQNKNVNLTNYAYFLFISAFSGMEFTLTFLAVERLGNTSMQNAYMFIFIGFILAMVQGGYVRRKAHLVGEKKMALRGLMSIIPGLIIIAFTESYFVLYLGLFFLALGSAMVIPTLTSLVSLFSDQSEQGKVLGTFRSLGALGRVVGPVLASLLYWKLGSKLPYLIGAFLILIPIMILSFVKQKDAEVVKAI